MQEGCPGYLSLRKDLAGVSDFPGSREPKHKEKSQKKPSLVRPFGSSFRCFSFEQCGLTLNVMAKVKTGHAIS